MKKFFFCFIALAIFQSGKTQNSRYLVTFKNKGTNPFSLSAPAAFLSQRSIDRRTRYGISIDSTDLPVTPAYIDSIRLSGSVTILNISKWLNTVSIQTTDNAALSRINNFPFVKSLTSVATRLAQPVNPSGKWNPETEMHSTNPASRSMDVTDIYNYGSSFAQVHIHKGEFLHNIGLRGENMIIGMLDAGFQNYLTVKAFDSVRANGQVLGTWDFVARETSVNEDDSHGMQCFSTIASNIPGQFVGTAPKANFYLFRSEDAATEYPIEEHNWVCAAERLDSVGGDVISSSLGYNTFDPPFTAASHTYADMNGNTTRVAIGADLAAKKGILIVNSAGNEGSNSWHYLVSPADGDSVMAVGAVNAAGVVASFSSFGPSSDGQVKPDVASVGQGTVVQFPNNTIGTNNGTSFSAPNMAGLTTCLWQGFPEFNNMKIIDALRKAGSIAQAPDNRIGYGIPDVRKATMILIKQLADVGATINNCTSLVNIRSKDITSMKYEVERKLPGQNTFTKIHEFNGAGSTFSTQNYLFQDQLNNIQSGVISYRIRQILDTGSNSFFADYIDTTTITLTNACITMPDSIVLLPNPARSNGFSIRMTTAEAYANLTVNVYNALGQLVLSSKRVKGTGVATFDFPTANLAAGKYFVTIFNGDKLLSTKDLLKL